VFGAIGGGGEIGEHQAAAVDTGTIGEDELKLLGELGETAGGLAARGQEERGLALARVLVLVVDGGGVGDGGGGILELDLSA